MPFLIVIDIFIKNIFTSNTYICFEKIRLVFVSSPSYHTVLFASGVQGTASRNVASVISSHMEEKQSIHCLKSLKEKALSL